MFPTPTASYLLGSPRGLPPVTRLLSISPLPPFAWLPAPIALLPFVFRVLSNVWKKLDLFTGGSPFSALQSCKERCLAHECLTNINIAYLVFLSTIFMAFSYFLLLISRNMAYLLGFSDTRYSLMIFSTSPESAASINFMRNSFAPSQP